MVIEKVDSSTIDKLSRVAEDTYLDSVYQKRITEMIEHDQLAVFAALESDHYIGRVSLWLAPVDEELPRKKYPGVPFVNALEVRKEFRQNGVATRLLNALENDVRARGLYSIALGVEPENTAAINLYKKLGYKLTGDIYQSCWEEANKDGSTKQVCVDCQLMLKEV